MINRSADCFGPALAGQSGWRYNPPQGRTTVKGGSPGRPPVRFRVFELDLERGELRKSGVLIHLPPQPAKVLALLAGHPGQLVTREEIR